MSMVGSLTFQRHLEGKVAVHRGSAEAQYQHNLPHQAEAGFHYLLRYPQCLHGFLELDQVRQRNHLQADNHHSHLRQHSWRLAQPVPLQLH